jgi:hypothetical protein
MALDLRGHSRLTVDSGPVRNEPMLDVPRTATSFDAEGSLAEAAARSADDVLAQMGSSPAGLSAAAVLERRAQFGPNALWSSPVTVPSDSRSR